MHSPQRYEIPRTGIPSERTKHGSPPLFVHRAEGIQGGITNFAGVPAETGIRTA
nr:MAG TPA: hypothetical protein [Caudoviricetes sp.]